MVEFAEQIRKSNELMKKRSELSQEVNHLNFKIWNKQKHLDRLMDLKQPTAETEAEIGALKKEVDEKIKQIGELK